MSSKQVTPALCRNLLATAGLAAMLAISSSASAQMSKETKTTTETTMTKESTGNGASTTSNGAADVNGASNGSASGKSGTQTTKQSDTKSAATDLRSAMEPSEQKMRSMEMTGNIDRDYATMMRAHHQGAVDMSKVELANGKNAEIKRMAQKIINNNQKEISQLDKWLNKQKSSTQGSSTKAAE
jgi:hypothetical protein